MRRLICDLDGEISNAYRMLVGKPQGLDPIERQSKSVVRVGDEQNWLRIVSFLSA
jgi:hypothetical protein